AKPARNLSMRGARDWDCPTNIISSPKKCAITLSSTRKSCSRITIAGKKFRTNGARKIQRGRKCSMTEWNEEFLWIFYLKFYIFTHDSIGVGEDGPTHEPVETVSSVRLMPHIDVIRPADPEETAGAFVAAVERIDGPTLIALTRQVVPILNQIDANLRREGVLRGGYI